MSATRFPKSKIEIRLCERIHPAGVALLKRERYQCTTASAVPRARELDQLLASAHGIGVRSGTVVNGPAIGRAKRLLTIGCFCVGTNNVDLEAATRAGVPVFHAPHSSTRSVAELTIGLLVALARRIVEKSAAARRGRWAKSAEGCTELRGRTLGIVGYGHIGSQVSVLAESFGMRVIFHDVADKQPLGNARPVSSLDGLLREADFITLHVPGGDGTKRLMDQARLSRMKRGAFLVNTSRGSVVDEDALERALTSGKLGGAALDVLETEPRRADGRLASSLRRLDNIILTPHVGGSTAEAQQRIAESVAGKMIRYINEGSTKGSVNFPNLELPRIPGTHRLIHVHQNVPGVLSSVNGKLGSVGANIEAQYLKTNELIGYLVVDVDRRMSTTAMNALRALPETIRSRRLF